MHLPPILDVRADLRRAFALASDEDVEGPDREWEAGDEAGRGYEVELADRDEESGRYLEDDLADEYETAVERLEAYAERGEADRQGELDALDNQLLRVQEKLEDDEASRIIEAARGRIHVYRDDLSNPGANLVVEDVDLSTPEGRPADVTDLRGDQGVVSARILNNGSARSVNVTATFVDEWGEVLSRTTGPEADLEAGEIRRFEFGAAVPGEAVAWAVTPAEVR